MHTGKEALTVESCDTPSMQQCMPEGDVKKQ